MGYDKVIIGIITLEYSEIAIVIIMKGYGEVYIVDVITMGYCGVIINVYYPQ